MTLRWVRVVAVGALAVLTASGCAFVSRASVDSSGTGGDGASENPAISADGRYVAFISDSGNLVPGDTNNRTDVFVRDTAAGTTTRVSVDSSGSQGHGDGGLVGGIDTGPAISADGRYVAFSSVSPDLVPGDTNGWTDVFVRDTVAGTTTRVSVSSSGAEGNLSSLQPAISADGRYVAFASGAGNLAPEDTGNLLDVFVRDTVAGTTTLVSGPASPQTNAASWRPAISADGRYVAFESDLQDLVPGDSNGRPDVFVRDMMTGTITQVSVGSGSEGGGGAGRPAISTDGRYIAFQSDATDLVPGDTNFLIDVFVRDTVAGTTSRVSVDSAGAEVSDNSFGPAISGDGRYVAFYSGATILVPGDTNGFTDVFVRDTVAGTTSRVSVDPLGAEGTGDSFWPAISADGRYVAFTSEATNLVPDDFDSNLSRDVFVRAHPQPVVSGVAPTSLPRGVGTEITVTGSGFIDGVVLSETGNGDGITFSDVTVVSPTEISAVATPDAGATPGSRSLLVLLLGTGPGGGAGAVGACSNCLTVT